MPWKLEEKAKLEERTQNKEERREVSFVQMIDRGLTRGFNPM